MKKKIGIFIASCILMLSLCGCSEEAAVNRRTPTGSDTIKIGVRIDIRNWGYYDKEKEVFSGAEVDYARALGKQLGYDQVELVQVTPETLKEKLVGGEADCLASKCTIMDTSKEEYEFSPGYYEDHGSFMVEKSSKILDLAGLVGKKIGIIRGSDVRKRVLRRLRDDQLITDADLKGTEILEFDSFEEISQALNSGDIEAFAADGCILQAWMNDQRVILPETYQDKLYGVAAIKDTPLSDSIQQAVEELGKEKVMEDILRKWY